MRDKKGKFAPGTSGNPNGRPRGSKHALSEAFLSDLVEHWEEHGPDAIARTFIEKPDVYLRVVASLIPKDFMLKHGGSSDLPPIQLVVNTVKAKDGRPADEVEK